MEFFINKFVVKKFDDNIYVNNLIEELNSYEFKGKIDFVNSPTCIYNTKDKFVMNFGTLIDSNSGYLDYVIDGKRIIVNTDDRKFIQVEQVNLSHKFSIQDFFNRHKDAYCIVFYTPDGKTIFHQGNKIRVYIDGPR